jgi:hypothetical protein
MFHLDQRQLWRKWYLILLFAGLFQLIMSSGKTSTEKEFIKYATSCVFTFENNTKISSSCMNALFSPKSFGVKGKVVVSSDDLCSALQRPTTLASQTVIFLANRGKCSFDEKAKNAVTMKAAGVVIINSERDSFPMGGMSPDLIFSIPVVMIGNSSDVHEFFVSVISSSGNSVVSLRKENTELKTVDGTTNLWLISLIRKYWTTVYISFAVIYLFCLCQFSEAMLSNQFWGRVSTNTDARAGKFYFADLSVAVVVTSALCGCFIFSRIATFRLISFQSIMNNSPVTLFESYHHLETDEIIFSVRLFLLVCFLFLSVSFPPVIDFF